MNTKYFLNALNELGETVFRSPAIVETYLERLANTNHEDRTKEIRQVNKTLKEYRRKIKLKYKTKSYYRYCSGVELTKED